MQKLELFWCKACITTTTAALGVATLLGQNTAPHAASSFAGPIISTASSSATSGSPDPSLETLTKNRARVFQGRISPRGVDYWSIEDSDLKRFPSFDQLSQHLSPAPIKTSDVRELDMVVDIKEPLTIFKKPEESVSMGSGTIEGKQIHNISVTSIISVNRLAIISK